MSTTTAATPTGAPAVATLLANAIKGSYELMFKLSGTGELAGADGQNIILFPGGWRSQAQLTASIANTTFEGEHFTSHDELHRYFSKCSTQVQEIRMETDDVSNFLEKLIITTKEPTGEERKQYLNLSKYRVPSSNSSGFSETLIIPAKDLVFMPMPFYDVMLSKIKRGSYVQFYMTIEGATKTVYLT